MTILTLDDTSHLDYTLHWLDLHDLGRRALRKMAAKVMSAVVMVSLHRRFLDGGGHPLDLAIGPRMVGSGQPMFGAVCFANQVEVHLAECDAVAISKLLCELDTIVSEDGVDLVRHRLRQELTGRLSVGFLDPLRDSELTGLINGHKEIELAFLGSHLSDVDMGITNRVSREPLPLRFAPFDVWRTGSSMALKTTMQARACQARDRRLQSITAIVQGQQRMPSEIASSSSARPVGRGSLGPVF